VTVIVPADELDLKQSPLTHKQNRKENLLWGNLVMTLLLLVLLGLLLLQLLIRLLIPVTQLPRPIRLLPQLLPELPLPPANSRLILNPEPVLLVVRGISGLVVVSSLVL
jgi:hypothetical protein